MQMLLLTYLLFGEWGQNVYSCSATDTIILSQLFSISGGLNLQIPKLWICNLQIQGADFILRLWDFVYWVVPTRIGLTDIEEASIAYLIWEQRGSWEEWFQADSQKTRKTTLIGGYRRQKKSANYFQWTGTAELGGESELTLKAQWKVLAWIAVLIFHGLPVEGLGSKGSSDG